MVILTKLDYGLSLVGAFVIGVAVVLAARMIRNSIQDRQLERQAMYELELDRIRTEIRLAVQEELGGGPEDDPEHQPGPDSP